MPDNQTTLLSASDTMYQPNVDKDKDVITTDNVQLRNDKGLGIANDISAPLCYNCGNQTQRAGSCYVCTSCGSTTGCS